MKGQPMARNTTINLVPNEWTQLTGDDVFALTFQNRAQYPMFVKGTTDATAPTDLTGAIRYNPGQGELNTPLSDLFPGIAAVRVWAISERANDVMVSHA
jgi:hypothetical protein